MAKQKAKTQTAAAPVKTSKRAGYKRATNKRINVLEAKLDRIARKAMRQAQYDKSLTFVHPEKKV